MDIVFIIAGGLINADTEVLIDAFGDVLGAEFIENLSQTEPAPKDTALVDAKIVASGWVRTGSWVWVNDSINSAMDNGIWAALVRPWGGEGNQR